MAELSADALAIVDRLKREGDLNRNSGTNSIRSVKIELSKFQDIFKSISTNIAAQSEVLKVQTNLAKEAAEKAETQEQFKEIEPQQTKYEKTDDETNTKLVTESENKKINAMGDAIRSALSFKNLALAGAGLFVGYNFLKGFIDEKTGGGFTEFERNIGPFARSLPIIGKALTDFPGTLNDLRTTIEKLGENLGILTKSIGDFLKEYSTPLALLGGLFGLIGFGGLGFAGGLMRLVASIIDAMNKGPKVPVPGPATPPTTGQKPGAPGPGKPGAPVPGAPGAPGTQSPGTATPPTTRKDPRRPRGNTTPRSNYAPTGAALEQAAASAASRAKTIDDIEKGVIDPKMRKIFGKIIFKALPALQVGFTLYQAAQLMVILNSDISEKDKVGAVGSFLGTLLGAFSGGVGGAILGATFGGPWGAIIGGVIGSVSGGLAGDLIGGYIAKWAFGEDRPSQEEIDKLNRQIGIDQYLDKVEARPEKPMNPGRRGYGAQAKAFADWNAKYAETHNPDGTPKASQGSGTAMGGRGNIVEQPGEREAYMKAEAERQAALNREVLQPGSSVLLGTPEDMVTPGTNRRNGLNTVSGNGSGGAGAVIINAPVSAPSSINLTNGGSSVNQLSISGGGGGSMGPSMLPYGLTNAYN